jgi:hypothetical protein
MKSVKRTTENSVDLAVTIPAVRFTDYDPSASSSQQVNCWVTIIRPLPD